MTRRLTRRTMLARATALGTAAATGPWIVRDALSSSGTLNLLNWDDELPNSVVLDFTKQSGIKINTTPFSQNDEQIGILQAARGAGFDLCQPTHDRAPRFRERGLLQPLDPTRMDLDSLLPGMLAISTTFWTWDGKLFHVPHCWGTEAISWRTDLTTPDAKTLSYGTIWDEQYRGRVQGRAHSLLLGIGLWLDASGRLPSNRMLDTYRNEAAMRAVYDQILAFASAHRSWIKQFWDSGDTITSALLDGSIVIGQTSDVPPITLKKSGKPVSYMAPREGAITWLDGWSMPTGAKNIDQAYEWLKFVHSADGSARIAAGSGYNPVAKGANALLSPATRKCFAEAYPGDALQHLWPRPAEPTWFAPLSRQYGEKFKAA